MADLGNTFDPQDVPEDERSFTPMPAGDYTCQIVESEIIKTKSGGDMLKLTIEIMEGPFANRKVWDNLNIRNASAQAQRIAHRTLADICSAVGAGAICDSEELHFKPFVAELKIEPEHTVGDRTYDARNGVKRYRGRGGQAPSARSSHPAAEPSRQTSASPPAQRAATGNRPWAKSA